MKIGLLAAGITPEDLLPRFDSYAGMFVTQLKEQNPRFEFETFNVRDNIFPDSVCWSSLTLQGHPEFSKADETVFIESLEETSGFSNRGGTKRFTKRAASIAQLGRSYGLHCVFY